MTTSKSTRARATVSEEVPDLTPPETVVSTDVDTIVGEPDLVTLQSGLEIRVQPLKTRETLKLLKIITRGAADFLPTVDWGGMQDNPTEFGVRLMTILAIAIPEAENEVIDFIRVVSLPEDYLLNPRTSAERKQNDEVMQRASDELQNPELEDMIEILAAVARNESGNLLSLGKKMAALFRLTSASDAVNSSSSQS